MKKVLILTILFILTIADSFAVDTPQNTKTKEYFFGITSWRVLGAQAYHLNFGKYLTKYDFISLDYGVGKYHHLELLDSHRPTFEYIDAGVYYRRFVPNSFSFLSDSLNIFFGVYRQFWTGDVNYEYCNGTVADCPNNDKLIKVDMKTQVTIASLGVGTHWMLDNGLTFGVDWAILSKPLYKHTDTFIHESAPDISARQQIQKDLNRLEDDLIDVATKPMLIVVTLGWSF